MPATVEVFVDNGAGPTPQSTTLLTPANIRFKTADDALVNTANPIPIPTGSPNRSFWKHIYIKVTASGGFNFINTIRFFTNDLASPWPTGVTVYIGNETPTRTSVSTSGYDIATGTVGTTGNELVVFHNGISNKTLSSLVVSGTPLIVPISESLAQLDAVGETSHYVLAQMDVANTASPGDLSEKTWTFQYDEV